MNKKRSLWIIVGLTILNAIGMTIVFPLFPFLIGKYVLDAKVALTLSVLVSVFAFCQFLAAPIFGALSDRYGRKIILITSLLGSVVGGKILGAMDATGGHSMEPQMIPEVGLWMSFEDTEGNRVSIIQPMNS